jgi:hypothetical protein
MCIHHTAADDPHSVEVSADSAVRNQNNTEFPDCHEQTDVGSFVATPVRTAAPWDVLLVQDISSSLLGQMSYVRNADTALVDCLRDHSDGSPLIGLVTFTGCGFLNRPLAPISTGYTSMVQAIAAMNACGTTGMPPCSGSNIGQAIRVSVDHFISTPRSVHAFGQAIVILTDGLPTVSVSGCGPGNTASAMAAYAVLQADRADTNAISIFVIHYQDNDPSAPVFLASLVRGYGKYVGTPNPTDLSQLALQFCDLLTAKPIPLMPAIPD